jgi:hypothetical protein
LGFGGTDILVCVVLEHCFKPHRQECLCHQGRFYSKASSGQPDKNRTARIKHKKQAPPIQTVSVALFFFLKLCGGAVRKEA